MAFDIRCPECKAKLRLDEAPDPETSIECPRCGSQFGAPDSAPAAVNGKSKSKPKKEASSAVPKRKKARKKRTNPVVLLIIIGIALFLVACVGAGLIWLANRPGKVEDMLAVVPGDCNWARGVNVGQLAAYPGYNDQVNRFNTPPVQGACSDLAKAAGQDSIDFLNYLVIAKSRQTSGTGTMYVIRSNKSFKPDVLGAGLPGSSQINVNGTTCYRAGPGASGILAGATVFIPSNRIIVIVPPGPMASQLASGSVAGKSNKKESFAGKLDPMGWIAVKGSIWLVIKPTGALSNYITESLGGAEKDFPRLGDKAKTAKCFGIWSTPGGAGVRVGMGIECATSKDADELASYFRSGPLGKGDESEPPNEFKRVVQFASDRRAFGEFMQNLDYRTKRAAAYFTTKSEGDNAKRVLALFSSPTMGSDQAEGGFGGGPLGPPGGP